MSKYQPNSKTKCLFCKQERKTEMMYKVKFENKNKKMCHYCYRSFIQGKKYNKKTFSWGGYDNWYRKLYYSIYRKNHKQRIKEFQRQWYQQHKLSTTKCLRKSEK